MQKDLGKFPIIKLAQRYKTMLSDTRMLSLRASIEVVRGRIQQLAERIDFNDAPDRLNKLDEAWKDYKTAKELDHGVEMIIAEKKLDELFSAAREDYLAWSQMLMALDLDRKLVDSEVKIVKELRAILTAEDAYDLVAKLLSVVLRVFPDDRKKLRRVQYEFIKLIGDRNIDMVEAEPDEDTLEGEAEDDEEQPIQPEPALYHEEAKYETDL